MKKPLIIVIAFLLMCAAGFAQISGTKTIPGDYASIAQAIAALNTSGVGTGGVTFNVATGYTETFATLTDGLITTTSSSLTKPIVFKKNGAGANPTITAAAGTASVTESIICLQGTDYITFDGIDLNDPSGTVEWGYAILKASGTDGSQFVTIKNCRISMNISNTATVAIYSNNVTPSAPATALTVTAAGGENSNLKIFGNIIANTYSGIYLKGYADAVYPYTYYDQGNEIGKDGANVITNVGGGTATGYGIYTIYQNALKVANNNITSTMAGTATEYGIFLTTANNGSYDLYNNNVSMQFSGTGSGDALYPIYCDMGANGTSNVVNIYNNTVTNCTFATLTSANVYLMYFNNMGVNNYVYGNSVTNNIIGSTGVTATGRINYIYANPAPITYGTFEMHDNVVSGNSRVQSVTGGGANYFMAAAGKGNLLNFYNNTVTNNIGSSTGGTYIFYVSFDIGAKNVYNNVGSNITKAEGTVYGLYSYNVTSSSGTSTFYRNKITNIEGLSTGSTMYGIYNTAQGGPAYFYNNMISDLRNPASTGTNSLYGLYLAGTTNTGFYDNTIFLTGTSSGANYGSSLVYASSSSSALDLRNNILVSNVVPKGTGKACVIFFNYSTSPNYNALSNYNDIYISPGTSSYFFWNTSVGDQTLAAYQTRMYPRDNQSVTELPPFVNITAAATDVHLKSTVATQCESGGVVVASPVSITTDFDNTARFPNAGFPVNGNYNPNAPDIGADEVGGIPQDITPPSITFTPLNAWYNGNARTLTATITDGSTVPTSGPGLPRLYWKINTGSYQSTQGTWVSGNTYTFTFGAGTVIGDLVYYYVVAQDNAPIPNVTSNPWPGAAGYTANPPACSTLPTTPYMYQIMTGMSGVYHVGVGKDYTTLTNAVTDINAKFISGPLTLVLDDATYPGEAYPIVLTPNPGSSATNVLTIKPNTGISPVFTGSTAGGWGSFTLSGFDYLILDGSNNGSTSRNLTIDNPNGGGNSFGILIQNGSGNDPANNITIKNCKIKAVPINASAATVYPIKFSATGGGYANCVIDNNLITGGFDGIQLTGAATGIITNTQIINNIIGSVIASEYITRVGIYMQYADNTLISNNEIMGPADGSLNTGQSGIYIGNNSTNTKVRKNKIHDFYHNSDDGWGASGLWYAAEANTVTEISNNLIYHIKAPGINPGVGQNISYGMFFRSGGNVKILHNTISLTGPYLSTLYDASSACLAFYYQATGGNFEVRDNILRNSMTPTTLPGSPLGKAYGIMISTPPTMFSIIDNNDFYIDGYNGQIAQKYTNGFGIDFDFPTLSSWQTYTGQEANSLTVNPVFASPTNLLPTTNSMPHAGAYLPLVPTDYNGVNRTNPPDMGAYEFTANPQITTSGFSAVTNNSASLSGTANATGTTFSLFFDWGLTTSYGNTGAATPAIITGNLPTNMNINVSGLAGNTTYHFRARGVTPANVIVYGNDMTFTTIPDPPSVVTTAASGITSTAATLNGTVNANSASTTVTFEFGLTTAYGSTINATPDIVTGSAVTPVSVGISGLLPNQLYHYRVKGVNSTGTSYGADLTFTTIAIVPVVVTNLANPVGTTTATLNGTVTANNAATTVTFQWGLTTAYGNTATATPGSAGGMGATAVSAALSSLAINTTYHFRCVGVNTAGTVYGQDVVFATNCVAPVVTISGPATGCSGTTGYVYTTEAGNSNYSWTVSAGGTITAGAGTNTITVTWNTAGSQTVSVNYNNSYGCSAGTPTVKTVTVNPSPAPTITGSSTACVNFTNNTYSTQSGMTGYVWTVSSGGTITAGQGTNAITVTWTTTGAKTVTANYANASGCLAPIATVLNVMVNQIPTPTITGQNSLCANSGYIPYTTETGMTGYVWTVSAGGTITSGQGTNTIQVSWITPGTQTVSVNYANANGCAAVTPTSYTITVNSVPSAAGSVTGAATVCGGAQGVAYSTPVIAGASAYAWTLPAGATIASGAYTNSITVNFAPSSSSGNISVAGNNLCGNGTTSPNFPITVNSLPASAGTVTGDANVCEGSTGHVYSVPSVANATNYTWNIPTGATITSGANSNTITVSFGMSAASGNISVTGVNSCGTGTVSPNFAVAVHTIPPAPVVTVSGNTLTSSSATGNQWLFEGNAIAGATGQTYVVTNNTGYYSCVVNQSGCISPESNKVWIVVTGQNELPAASVNIFPVPSDGRFTVSLGSQSEEVFAIGIFNNLGVMIHEVRNIIVNGKFDQVIDLRPTAAGLYTVVVRSTGTPVIRKVIVRQ